MHRCASLSNIYIRSFQTSNAYKSSFLAYIIMQNLYVIMRDYCSCWAILQSVYLQPVLLRVWHTSVLLLFGECIFFVFLLSYF